MPGEILQGATLNEVKINEDKDGRPIKHCKASYASTLSLSIESYLLSLNIMCPPMGLASANTMWGSLSTWVCITWHIQKLPLHSSLLVATSWISGSGKDPVSNKTEMNKAGCPLHFSALSAYIGSQMPTPNMHIHHTETTHKCHFYIDAKSN